MQFSGAVLAGGRSSRFGQDKARFIFEGKPLIGWVLDGLGQAAERFIISGRDYSEFAPTYADVVLGGDVMSGLHAALHHSRHEWVAVAGCDQPFLSQGYWAFLLEQASQSRPAVVALSPDGYAEPLGGLYHKSLEGEMLLRLQAGRLKVQSLLLEVGALMLPSSELKQHFGSRLFVNANTLHDLLGSD